MQNNDYKQKVGRTAINTSSPRLGGTQSMALGGREELGQSRPMP